MKDEAQLATMSKLKSSCPQKSFELWAGESSVTWAYGIKTYERMNKWRQHESHGIYLQDRLYNIQE